MRMLLGAALVAALSSPALAVDKDQPKPAAADTPKAAPKQALLAAADEIVHQVAGLRGLTPRGTLARGVLARQEIGAKIQERFHKEYTADEIRAETRVLKRLGLLPPDVDYEKLILDLLMEQVAGFYDPFAARLYIADWLPLELQRPALAHEIEHALQDQHFDLKKFSSPIKDDGDRQLARSALVEGDGTAVMLEFQAQSMGLPADQLPELVAQIGRQMMQGGLGQTPLLDKAPALLKETLIFPYFAGLTFVEALKKSGWPSIDAVWKSPPESTEQVLHPEKYAARERPIAITPGPLPSLGKKEMRRDVLGELEMKVWFGERLDDDAAARAAAGWGGDRLVAYAESPAAPPTVIDLSTWDTEGDAKEAEAAARQVVAKLAGKTDAAAAAPLADPNGEVWAVERRGLEVLVACALPAAAATAVVGEVWKSWKVARSGP